ncbi:MAG TPA: hypothetical protein PKD26_12515 [Pyrinomonadaceae bacterium]|nr:hypothetical protein [Pyrinomonadaceae bacterium]
MADRGDPMNVQWEEFTQKANFRAEMLRVSLNARGHFVLNQKAVEELGSPEALVLLFDKTRKLIGMKGSSAEIEHSYQLKKHGTSQNHSIRAKSFCSFYNIDVGDTLVFHEIEVDDGVLILDLAKTSEVVRRTRMAEFPTPISEQVRPVPPVKFSTLLRMRSVEEE